MEKVNELNPTEEIIKSVTEDLIGKMGFSGEISIWRTNNSDSPIACNIASQDSNFLIGQYGINLQALQHIARLLVRKKTDEKVNFVLDVNQYRQEKNQSVIELAKEMAEEAVREGRSIVMRPMSAYERRLVHLALGDNDKVKTESIGEGETRKVVIAPKEIA